MKRWHWFSFALLAALLAVALIVVPRLGGGAERAQAADPVSLVLDMNVTNGSGPCNPVDAARSDTAPSGNYQIAVCLGNAAAEPAGFEFQIVYDDTLNQCVPATSCAGTALDCNPDANTGTTTFSTPSLGQVGFDCSGGGVDLPNCDKDTAQGAGHGLAHITCSTVAGTPTLAIGAGVFSPLVEVTFNAIAGGVDTLSLDNVAVVDPDVNAILNCPGGPGTCADGTDNKTGTPPGPTSTPGAATGTPIATATPSCGLPGLPVCTPTPKAWTAVPTAGPTETATPAPSGGGGGGGGNPPPPPAPAGGTGPAVSAPSTGDGSGGVPWVTWLAISVMAGFGAISLVSGGLYLRRARMRQ